MGRLEKTIKKKEEKKYFKRKKLLVFFLIFIFFQGIDIVDQEYGNMMGYEREMIFGCRRVDDEIVKLYIIGNEVKINEEEIRTSIIESSDEAINKVKVYIYKIRMKIESLFHTNEFNPKGTKQV